MTYNEWIDQVDALLLDVIGACHLDLEDHLWHDDYDDGFKPSEAVEDFLYDKGYFLA